MFRELFLSLFKKSFANNDDRSTADHEYIDEQKIIRDIQAVLDCAETIPMPNLSRCIEHFRKDTTVSAQFRTAKGHLSLVPNLSETRGLDLACWCGFMTWMMRALGAKEVWGSDVVAEHVEAATKWSHLAKTQGIFFKHNEMATLPYEDQFFDWVVTSGLYSNLNPGATTGVFSEIYRILKPGAKLLFNDGGNIRHQPTRARIEARYREVEIGSGSAEEPAGDFYNTRLNIITVFAKDLDSATCASIARDTCYQWEPEIKETVEQFRTNGKMTANRFQDGNLNCPPVDPENGNAAARANDPSRIRTELQDAGFTVGFSQYAGTPLWTLEQEAIELPSGPGLFIVAEKNL